MEVLREAQPAHEVSGEVASPDLDPVRMRMADMTNRHFAFEPKPRRRILSRRSRSAWAAGFASVSYRARAGFDAASLGRATEDVTPRRFGMREALERVEHHGDLFEPVLADGQALGRPLKKLR
jgi:hypothetical protein